MAVQTWISGRIGNWFTPANWTTGQVPVPGDSAVINAGTATVSQPTPGPVAGVAGVSILLGGLDTGQPVTLEAVDAVFQAFSGASVINTVLTVTGGEPSSSPLNATFLAKGNTSFDGQILVSAKGGGLTIDSEPDSIGNAGNFTFNNADLQAVMVVGQESVLTFAGRTITNDGLIEVLGGSDIAAGVTFAGSGIVALESGGHMTIKGDVVGTGTVATSQKIDFADGTGSVTLANAAGFRGIFGFVPTVSGNRIDLTQIQAQSARYFRPTSAGLPGHLKLYAGQDGQGAELATLDMELIAAGNLGPRGVRPAEPFDIGLHARQRRPRRHARSPTRRRTASSSSSRWPRRSWRPPAPWCRSRASCRTPSARPRPASPASRCCPASRSPTPASTPATGARPTSRRHGW